MVVIFLNMNRLSALLLLLGAAAGQQCPDTPPDTTFPCDFQVVLGNCDKTNYPDLRNAAGELVYCLVTCGLCESPEVNLTAAQSATSMDFIPSPIPTAHGIPQDPLVTAVQTEMTEAIASLTEADLGADPAVAVISAAKTTTEAVANVIATAMSEDVQFSFEGGVTTDSNSFAAGVVNASAEAIAEAIAEAYSIAIAESGNDFTEEEASTFTTDIQSALATTAVELAITGAGTITSVSQTAYATAVAEAVAIATARAFAKITNTDSEAIVLPTVQAFNSTNF